MNLRSKLAALTLATGALVGGTAALSLSAAQAAPNPPIDEVPGTPPISVVTLPPVRTVPSTPPTTKPPTTTTTAPKCTDCDPDWTGSTAAAPVDPPVKATPAFTG
jgi:hypothetical protein